MPKVKEMLNRVHKDDQDQLKQALRSYNSDGYKVIGVMAFGNSALPAKNINSGTVIALMNPRLMPPSNQSSEKQQGLTLCIDSIDAVV